MPGWPLRINLLGVFLRVYVGVRGRRIRWPNPESTNALDSRGPRFPASTNVQPERDDFPEDRNFGGAHVKQWPLWLFCMGLGLLFYILLESR